MNLHHLSCYSFHGLCNRINGIASALATNRLVKLHWAVNQHCPVKFEDLFNPIQGLSVINEAVNRYATGCTPDRICWFYPKNLCGVETTLFRKRLYHCYSLLLASLKPINFEKPEGVSIGLAFRNFMPERGCLEDYISQAVSVVRHIKPDSVHIASDCENSKARILTDLRTLDLSITTNQCRLLTRDMDRNDEAVRGMVQDLFSLRECRAGIISNTTRSSVPDSLRCSGVRTYYTQSSIRHRDNGRDDLFDYRPVKDLIDQN